MNSRTVRPAHSYEVYPWFGGFDAALQADMDIDQNPKLHDPTAETRSGAILRMVGVTDMHDDWDDDPLINGTGLFACGLTLAAYDIRPLDADIFVQGVEDYLDTMISDDSNVRRLNV